MSAANINFAEVPPVLPGSENEEIREKLLELAAQSSADEENDTVLEDESDESDELENLRKEKPSKRKILTAFAGFVLFFLLLLAAICWFFGIGVFAASKTQSVDRTTKTNSATTPVTEDEKLKIALNMVAEKNPAASTEPHDPAPNSQTAGPETSITLPSDNRAIPSTSGSPTEYSTATDIRNAGANPASDQDQAKPVSAGRNNAQDGESKGNLTGKRTTESNSSNTEITPTGRSLFFGIEPKKTSEIVGSKPVYQAAAAVREVANSPSDIAFGSLLPIRLVGTVFTLRNSSGFVRMELTRGIEGKGYAYPAGTIVVGTLRGSEFKRGFITVVGLIDPKTGQLVKFSGEVLGRDGASGISGRRRTVTSAWTKALSGLREAGTAALGAFGNLRSGGTVVISDSTQKASAVFSDQASGLIGGKQKSDEFVEIAAGTTGFVLVTSLPAKEQSVSLDDSITNGSASLNKSPTISGLSDEELADLFSEASPEKLRATMPRMTPAFRKLAEQALTSLKSE